MTAASSHPAPTPGPTLKARLAARGRAGKPPALLCGDILHVVGLAHPGKGRWRKYTKDESRAVRAGLRLPGPTAQHHHAANTSPALVLSCTDPLRVTLTPKKLKTGIGSTVILSCALSGSPEYVIRWYRNTDLVVVDDYISIRGISNETLLITAAQKSHSGAYQCFATRKSQTAQDFSIIMLEGELASLGRGPAGAFLCPSPSCRTPGAHQDALCMDGGKRAPLGWGLLGQAAPSPWAVQTVCKQLRDAGARAKIRVLQ